MLKNRHPWSLTSWNFWILSSKSFKISLGESYLTWPTWEILTKDKIKLLEPRLQQLIRTYPEVFGEPPPPASPDKLVQMDLKLKPEFLGHKVRRRPYSAPKEQAGEIERQIQECIDAGLVLEYKDGDYPQTLQPSYPGGQAWVYSQTTGS